MKCERNLFDTYKYSYLYQRHHERYRKFVEHFGFPCQECHTSGKQVDDIIDGYYLIVPCGWCEGTGKVTRWLRGEWLRYRKSTKREMA